MNPNCPTLMRSLFCRVPCRVTILLKYKLTKSNLSCDVAYYWTKNISSNNAEGKHPVKCCIKCRKGYCSIRTWKKWQKSYFLLYNNFINMFLYILNVSALTNQQMHAAQSITCIIIYCITNHLHYHHASITCFAKCCNTANICSSTCTCKLEKVSRLACDAQFILLKCFKALRYCHESEMKLGVVYITWFCQP